MFRHVRRGQLMFRHVRQGQLQQRACSFHRFTLFPLLRISKCIFMKFDVQVSY
jgi:hypothetical protein